MALQLLNLMLVDLQHGLQLADSSRDALAVVIDRADGLLRAGEGATNSFVGCRGALQLMNGQLDTRFKRLHVLLIEHLPLIHLAYRLVQRLEVIAKLLDQMLVEILNHLT